MEGGDISQSAQPEDTDVEHKARWDGSAKEWLVLIQTIAAMANTDGGQIVLNGVSVDPKLLDSARIEDRVSKHLRPGIPHITSEFESETQCLIRVGASAEAPHIFILEGTYRNERSEDKTVFYRGQVYARHASKTDPATDHDIERLVRRKVTLWLEALASAVTRSGMSLGGAAGPEVKYRLSNNPDAPEMRAPEIDKTYPYFAKTLGEAIGKDLNWVQVAAKVLGIKDDPALCHAITGTQGQIVTRRYSNEVLAMLSRTLEEDPNFNPYRPGQGRDTREFEID